VLRSGPLSTLVTMTLRIRALAAATPAALTLLALAGCSEPYVPVTPPEPIASVPGPSATALSDWGTYEDVQRGSQLTSVELRWVEVGGSLCAQSRLVLGRSGDEGTALVCGLGTGTPTEPPVATPASAWEVVEPGTDGWKVRRVTIGTTECLESRSLVGWNVLASFTCPPAPAAA
jgi:hypothetical protein